MGFLERLLGNNTPKVESLLPQVAINEIMSGRLPILKTNRIFLEFGENCHYMDNAIYQKEKKVRVAARNNQGYRMPGLFKGTSYMTGRGQTVSRDEYEYKQINGILFITNQRIIFSASNDGFVYELSKLTAMNPYANAVELQFGNKIFTVFVPDGNVISYVLHNLK